MIFSWGFPPFERPFLSISRPSSSLSLSSSWSSSQAFSASDCLIILLSSLYLSSSSSSFLLSATPSSSIVLLCGCLLPSCYFFPLCTPSNVVSPRREPFYRPSSPCLFSAAVILVSFFWCQLRSCSSVFHRLSPDIHPPRAT